MGSQWISCHVHINKTIDCVDHKDIYEYYSTEPDILTQILLNDLSHELNLHVC